MVAGLSHDEFWDLAPKEAYLSIKAHKAREDAHYGQLAVFVATLTNATGNTKKPVKPSDLYEPQLSPGKKKMSAKEKAQAGRAVKEEIERLAALAPAPQPPKSEDRKEVNP